MGNKPLYAAAEEDLIAMAIRGEAASLGELYRRYFPKVVYRCLSIVKDRAAADDLAQDVLLRAIDKLPSLQLHTSFSSWLYTIATNHSLEYLQKEKQRHTVSLEEGLQVSNEDLESDSLQFGLLKNKLYIFLHQLSAEDQRLVVQKYCHNLSIRELQQHHRLSASAIKMRLKRAREKLVQLFYQSQ